MIGPSVKTLIRVLGIADDKAKECRKIFSGDYIPSDYLKDAPSFYYSRDVRLKLRCLNSVIGGYGVETIDSVYPERNILYVNLGDPYIATITYRITYRSGVFRAECWGNVVERNERDYL